MSKRAITDSKFLHPDSWAKEGSSDLKPMLYPEAHLQTYAGMEIRAYLQQMELRSYLQRETELKIVIKELPRKSPCCEKETFTKHGFWGCTSCRRYLEEGVEYLQLPSLPFSEELMSLLFNEVSQALVSRFGVNSADASLTALEIQDAICKMCQWLNE